MSGRHRFEPLPDVPLPARVQRAWMAALEAAERERPEGWHLEEGIAAAAGCSLDESWNCLCAGVAAGTVQVTIEAPPPRCWVRVTPARERAPT